MKPRELTKLGVPSGKIAKMAVKVTKGAADQGMDRQAIRAAIRHILDDPQSWRDHEIFGPLAIMLTDLQRVQSGYEPRKGPAPYATWGKDLDPAAVRQMDNACSLPISIQGALLPDAHVGYGLPIGGVLACDNAVIPYAVGMDIACRMRMSVIDADIRVLQVDQERLIRAIEHETRFGVGSSFTPPRNHPVMDEDWTFSRITKRLKNKAWEQLGTSGAGNHFVEFGILKLEQSELGLEPGEYTALLSHSGSRGTGGEIASYFSRRAREIHPELPRELLHLAWLDMDDELGQEYWKAMELMGKYSHANHELIHTGILGHLGFMPLASIENHHNFAWKEILQGKKVIVHRKGATPAGKGVKGIIPGSMTMPAYLVRGRGNPCSLYSASHGAGRCTSRKQAKQRYSWADIQKELDKHHVTLISAGRDQAPMAYKNIHEVMDAQKDLVETIGLFYPRLVKMAAE
jgi:tRNA-splicing ligase RtcB